MAGAQVDGKSTTPQPVLPWVVSTPVGGTEQASVFPARLLLPVLLSSKRGVIVMVVGIGQLREDTLRGLKAS